MEHQMLSVRTEIGEMEAIKIKQKCPGLPPDQQGAIVEQL